MNEAPVRRTASCSCGRVSLTTCGEPVKASACYCGACRRRTGSAFGVAIFFARDAVVIGGDTNTYSRPGDSGRSVTFHFCPHCGSTVYWYPEFRPAWIAVAIGCFDDGTLAPTQTAYGEQRPDWVHLALATAPPLA